MLRAAATVALRHASRRNRHLWSPWLGRVGSFVHAGPNRTSSLAFTWGSSSIAGSSDTGSSDDDDSLIPRNWRELRTVDGLGYDKPFPCAIDWRKDGCVTSVKDQGPNSTTCWAFGPTVAMEALNKQGNDVLEELSTQDIIDNCKGATNDTWAYNYAKVVGVHYAKDYPSKKGIKPLFRIKGYRTGFLYRGDDEELIHAVTYRVVSAAMTLPASFFKYKGGLYKARRPMGAESATGHCVAIIGFEDNYWLVQNSRGTEWGEKGIMKMSRSTLLALLDSFSYPTYIRYD